MNRRRFLLDGSAGLASLAFASLCSRDGAARPRRVADDGPIRPVIDSRRPLAARASHFEPAAKNVLVVFCSGALSHVDSFDYKPELIRLHGQPMPGAEGLVTFQGKQGNLTRSPWTFRRRGQCGKWTSDLLPNLGELVDRMCFVHSMTSESPTHGPAENFMSTGFTLDGFPSMGSWISYALGSENEELPAFVAIPDPRGVPQSSVNNWGSGFLPATFQGVPWNAKRGVRNLERPASISEREERDAHALLQGLNRSHLARQGGDRELEARIASYELAARMQLSVPEVSDVRSESEATRRLYGVDDPNTLVAGFARNCLLARRLLERGVRFVQLFNGAYAMGEGVGNWDGHKQLEQQYRVHAPILDRPLAGLLLDLERRGMLSETLVVFTTEFGRMPTFQEGASGRDHNPHGFTVWFAGAGVKAPFTYGATDEFGYRAAQDVCSTHDLHATLLHLVGLDHERLTFLHDGIERRLTNVAGRVIAPILSA
ncbi:MAG: DUF1501 domain-containing protein [Planctomycetes bacterium]|nr:DUF1501 domain-containing protein [Planctomycetota bacterium]